MLPDQPEFFLDLLEHVDEGVYVVDRSRRITYWNAAAEHLTGYRREEIIGSCCADSILRHVDLAGRNVCASECPLNRAIDGMPVRTIDMFMRHKDGHRIPVRIRAIQMKDQRGNVMGAAELFSETSSRDELARRISELQRLALVDSLTGLPNRRYLEAQVAGRLDELKRYGWPFGVLFLDVDGFKPVNDLHGHLVGDDVLRMLGRTLGASSRMFDTVGRWGGDEFLAVVANVQKGGLIEVAERFRTLVSTSSVPSAEGLRVTVSIGAALASADDDMESLLKRADELLYDAKRSGRNRVSAQRSSSVSEL